METRTVDTVASVAVVLGGVALVFIHYYAGSHGDPEGWFAALGFGAPYIGAGLLALVGTLRAHPALVLAAGVALIPMSILSIVLLPLLIPAVLLMVRAVQARFDPQDLAVPVLLAFGLVTVLAILVFHRDPVTWSTPYGGGSSSNIVTTSEAAIALSATVAAVFIATVRPTRQRER